MTLATHTGMLTPLKTENFPTVLFINVMSYIRLNGQITDLSDLGLLGHCPASIRLQRSSFLKVCSDLILLI